MKGYLVLLIGLFLSSCANGQLEKAENGIDHSTVEITDNQSKLIFKNVRQFPNNTELSIAFIHQGKTTFVGVKRTDDIIKISENHQSAFEIGSISKVFTSSLLSSFVLNEELALEDAIQNHLDLTLKTDEKITFKELANHTSGLPRLPSNLNLSVVDPSNPYKEYDAEKLIEYLTEEVELQQKPGTEYGYSNLGAGLLGYGLAKMSNSSYEDLLQERIFEKYGMSNSTTQPDRIKAKIIHGLNPNGEVTSGWDLNVLAGAGAILSTTEDLSKFALAQFDSENKELVLTQESTFKVDKNMRVGLGWHILPGENGDELIWHNGGTGGYTSSIALDTKNEKGIIILSNVSAFNSKMGTIDELCFELIKTL